MERELKVAINAAVAAGAVVRRWYDQQDFTTVEKKGDKGPLTEADLESNQTLIDHIHGAFPDDGLLSEETKDTPERLGKSRVWIIDPIDGTREFTTGIPEFCVSVGFVVDGVPMVGALFNPATGQLIAGAVGMGCTLDGSPVHVSSHAAIEGARFLVSREEHKKGWFDKWQDQVTLQPCGSVAWKFGLVAAGLSEASFTPKPRNEWDICAGVACIQAAGGRTSDRHGEPYRFNAEDPLKDGVCGTNGAIHDHVLALMRAV